MNKTGYFCSTIGQKQLMAITGLLLSGFVLTHAAGNMLILVGSDAYNKYSYALISNPAIYLAEAGLVFFFFVHMFSAVRVTIRNMKARPKGYAQSAKGEKATPFTSKTMWLQGLVILGFVILHLITFKYGQHYETQVNGVTMRDLYKLVNEVFHDPIYVTWYIVALVILSLHLSHGVASSLQTLSLNHPKYTPKIKCASFLFAGLILVLFVSQPIYVFFFL